MCQLEGDINQDYILTNFMKCLTERHSSYIVLYQYVEKALNLITSTRAWSGILFIFYLLLQNCVVLFSVYLKQYMIYYSTFRYFPNVF